MAREKTPWYSLALHATLALSAVLIVSLAIQNRQLAATLADLLKSVPGNVRVGDALPGLAATELDGSEVALDFAAASAEQVVLFFSTTCSICEDNLDNWRELYERLADRYRFVAVGVGDPEAVRAYAEERALPYRVVVPKDWRYFSQLYPVTGVPQTIVLTRDGHVKDLRMGVVPNGFADRHG